MRTSPARTRPGAPDCTRRSPFRCAAHEASSASWSSSPRTCARRTSAFCRRWAHSGARWAEEEVRASESRLRAMLESALDAVVTMDHRGRILGWNHAAETTFGYRADEAIGRDMADLIVPPELRVRHREGLARFLETEQPVVLDRRLGLKGKHKNGIEFPLELTITRIGLPGPPTFTGYLRDISDRKQADGELRASRARLVEVADAERQRIQRNLHDGAQ